MLEANVRALVLVGAATLLLSAGIANAACIAPGINPGGQFCNGCRYEAQMTVSRDSVCERPYDQGLRSTGPIQELLNHRLVQRAKHGIAGVNGIAMAYAPAKGYVGKDDFTVAVDFRQGTVSGKYYVHWNVTVQ